MSPAVRVPESHRHVLRDGATLEIRPLLATDRDELRERYGELSSRSRRLRFVSAPEHLSERLLDHLLNVDFDTRYALVAALPDEPGQPGVGIARYARSRDDPTHAEAAVTVADAHQGRGIGTLLLAELVAAAASAGITTFVGDVMWENVGLLDSLREVGATVVPSEPGIAAVRVELPTTVDPLEATTVFQVMRTVATS